MAKSGPNKSQGQAVGLVGAGWFRAKKQKSRRKEQLAKQSRRKNRGRGQASLTMLTLCGIVSIGLYTVIEGHNRDQLVKSFNHANDLNMQEAFRHGVTQWHYPSGEVRQLNLDHPLCTDFLYPQDPRAEGCIVETLPPATSADWVAPWRPL